MAYKFNNGTGAVICDHCGITIDEGLSYTEYEECYGSEQKKDYCTRCFHPANRQKVKEESDGERFDSARCEA